MGPYTWHSEPALHLCDFSLWVSQLPASLGRSQPTTLSLLPLTHLLFKPASWKPSLIDPPTLKLLSTVLDPVLLQPPVLCCFA